MQTLLSASRITTLPAWTKEGERKGSEYVKARWMMFGAGIAATSGLPTFFVPLRIQTSANNTGTSLLFDNDNNNITIDIDSEQTTTDVVNISAAVLTTGNVIDIPDADTLSTGKILNLVSNSASTSTRTLVQLTNDNTAATGVTLFGLLQDSTGTSFSIDHNGITGKSLYIDAESTTQTAGVVDIAATVLTTGTAIDIGDLDALTSGIGINLVSNSADTGAFTLMVLTNDNTAATGASLLTAKNDSTGTSITIDHNGITGKALYVDSENTTQTAGVVDIDAAVLTTGTALDIGGLAAITEGKGLLVSSASATQTTAQLLDVNTVISNTGLSNRTGTMTTLTSSRTDARTSGTTADDYDVTTISRTQVTTGAGGTMTAAGSVLRLALTSTQTAGTLTNTVNVLEIANDASGGNDVYVTNTNAGATGVRWEAYHDSASPAAADVPFTLNMTGENLSGGKITYASMRVVYNSCTSGVEDAYLSFTVQSGGTSTESVRIQSGRVMSNEESRILSAFSTADTFDHIGDLEILSLYGPDPEGRQKFYEALAEHNIATRAENGTYWVAERAEKALHRGALKQAYQWLVKQGQMIEDMGKELGVMRQKLDLLPN